MAAKMGQKLKPIVVFMEKLCFSTWITVYYTSQPSKVFEF